MKDYLILNGIKLTFFYCLSKCHGLCTWKTWCQNKIISVRLRKYAVFRVITELTENLVGVKRTIIGTLLSDQFSTHFRAYRWNYKRISTIIVNAIFFCQRLHITGFVKWPFSY